MTEPNANPKTTSVHDVPPPEGTPPHAGHAEALTVDMVPEPTPALAPPPIAPVPPHERKPAGTPIWLTVVVIIVLGGGLGWLIYDRVEPSAIENPKVAALEAALRTAQQRIQTLEQRPTPDVGPIAARLGAVEAGLKNQRPAADTSALEQRLTSLEQRPAPAAPDVTTPIAAATAALTAKLDALDGKLAQVASQDAARAAAAARLRAAGAALDAGQKLGDIVGAPPALARFAQVAPPTEPALRQAFPAAAAAAGAASEPSPDGFNFAERMWRRTQSLVTVRQGDKVLVGAPASATLAAAQGKLDAGDLAGAMAALAALDGPAAAAMAGWIDPAKALLEARAALASLQARS